MGATPNNGIRCALRDLIGDLVLPGDPRACVLLASRASGRAPVNNRVSPVSPSTQHLNRSGCSTTRADCMQ